MIARKSTARTILVGPILDSTGAAVTTEVVGSLRITKNGTVSSLNASATLTHSHSGMYLLALTASDADTAGWCQISLTSGTNAMSPVNFHVVETAVFDALFAASAAGYQIPIWAAANSTVALTGTTIAPTQKVDVETIKTQPVTCSGGVTIPAATLASTTNITTVGAVSGSVGSVTGNVGGNVAGSVGSISGVSFPSNFALLGINASGHVVRVVLCDTVTTYTGNTPQTGDAFARLGAPAGASVSVDVAAVKSDTATLLSRITSTLFAGITYLARWLGAIAGKAADSSTSTEIRATTAGATYDQTTDSLEAQRDNYTAPLNASQTRDAVGLAAADLDTQLDAILAASGSTGSGAYTRTITVNDGTTALQGAKVRLSQGGEEYTGTTDASGQVVFAVDAATWDVAITKPRYRFTPTTLVVAASGSTTYSMTASGPTPSADPDKTVVRITCYGADTEVEASATVQLRQLTAPSGDEGHAFAGDWTTYTADASGIVDVTLWSDCTYAIRRGTTGDAKQFTPTGATDSFTSILSR